MKKTSTGKAFVRKAHRRFRFLFGWKKRKIGLRGVAKARFFQLRRIKEGMRHSHEAYET